MDNQNLNISEETLALGNFDDPIKKRIALWIIKTLTYLKKPLH
jgi:hypothetical protein